jgi:hypothetical protein
MNLMFTYIWYCLLIFRVKEYAGKKAAFEGPYLVGHKAAQSVERWAWIW